jgi:uncharacterized protein (DUF4415 family)
LKRAEEEKLAASSTEHPVATQQETKVDPVEPRIPERTAAPIQVVPKQEVSHSKTPEKEKEKIRSDSKVINSFTDSYI